MDALHGMTVYIDTPLAIPANPALGGLQFDVQAVDIDLDTNYVWFADNDVEATIVVDINNLHRIRSISHGKLLLFGKCTIAPAQQHRHIVGILIRRHEVEATISVDINHLR